MRQVGSRKQERLLRSGQLATPGDHSGSVVSRREEWQRSFDGSSVEQTVSSVVVVFELVAYGDYGNCRVVFDFEQRDVALIVRME